MPAPGLGALTLPSYPTSILFQMKWIYKKYLELLVPWWSNWTLSGSPARKKSDKWMKDVFLESPCKMLDNRQSVTVTVTVTAERREANQLSAAGPWLSAWGQTRKQRLRWAVENCVWGARRAGMLRTDYRRTQGHLGKEHQTRAGPLEFLTQCCACVSATLQASRRRGRVNSSQSSQRTGRHSNFHKSECRYFIDQPAPSPQQ